jgi:hypothetical protein
MAKKMERIVTQILRVVSISGKESLGADADTWDEAV